MGFGQTDAKEDALMRDRLREFFRRMIKLTRIEWNRIVLEKTKFDLAIYTTSEHQEKWARNNPWLRTERHNPNETSYQ